MTVHAVRFSYSNRRSGSVGGDGVVLKYASKRCVRTIILETLFLLLRRRDLRSFSLLILARFFAMARLESSHQYGRQLADLAELGRISASPPSGSFFWDCDPGQLCHEIPAPPGHLSKMTNVVGVVQTTLYGLSDIAASLCVLSLLLQKFFITNTLDSFIIFAVGAPIRSSKYCL